MNVRMLSGAVQRHQLTTRRVQEQISSGRKVSMASDDPGAYEMIRNLSADLNRLEQYKRNADMAKHYLSIGSQGLLEAVNYLHRINELAVAGTDTSLDKTSRTALAEEVDGLLNSIVSVANSSEGGRYNFAGLRIDVPPYEVVRDPATGRVSAVQYNGSEEMRTIKIGDASYIPTNLPGTTTTNEGGVFQTATRDIFADIIELRDELLADTRIDQTGVQQKLEDSLDRLLAQVSLNGAREEQVRIQADYNFEMQATVMQSRESLEAVDMAEAFMRLAQAENSYQAALYGTSQMIRQVSLLNYI